MNRSSNLVLVGGLAVDSIFENMVQILDCQKLVIDMKKILIVEDDLVMQSLYEDILTDEGFVVDKASNGLEADGKLSGETYDLVLMDVLLPGMNGVELLKKVKADKSHRNVGSRMLLLTALDDEHIANNAMESGATGYLLKFKMDPGQVLSKVKEALVN